MRRLLEFLRSVLPADPAQLLLLCGTVCLAIAPRLGWWPAGMAVSPGTVSRRLGPDTDQLIRTSSLLLMIFASVVGYFVCFWPGRHPVRRIVSLVMAPAALGMIVLLVRLIYLTAPAPSVLENSQNIWLRELAWGRSLPWRQLTGLHYCLLGLLLIGLFISRLAMGIASLPLSLTKNPEPDRQDSKSWQRLEFLIWFLIGPLFVGLGIFLAVGLFLPLNFSRIVQSEWFSRLDSIIDAGLILAITFPIIGKIARRPIWRSLRFPSMKYLLLAFSFPVVSSILLSAGQYAFDRIQWAANIFGQFDQPDLHSYFQPPNPWLLLLFFAALAEELIFRGLLQPNFIERYGLFRGIFLVGVVWAASHFVSDFSFGRARNEYVLALLGLRLFMCITQSFVFGWLTLASRSVLPAAIAHAFYNIFVTSDPGPPFVGKATVRILLWAAIAYLLFRYWPPPVTEHPLSVHEAALPASSAI